MKRPLKLSDISALLATSCLGLAGCSQTPPTSSERLSRRLDKEEPVSPGDWKVVRAFTELPSQHQQAMCYAAPPFPARELQTVAWRCPSCGALSSVNVDVAKDKDTDKGSINDFIRRPDHYQDLLARLNAAGAPFQLVFSWDSSGICRKCHRPGSDEGVDLVARFAAEPDRPEVKTAIGSVPFTKLIAFLERANPENSAARKSADQSLRLGKVDVASVRKVLGLKPD